MTNKKRYRITDKLADAFGKFLDNNPIHRLEGVEKCLRDFISFCDKTYCEKCPFFANDKEHCFIQWLNMEEGK